ncbi:MAG: prolyl oligopeptidase family serine peptidase [Planctomycetaceae bacterium]|nr:prolyl oligopeptidase family serine peptidase [Planctomycetaceae bacterium]
MTRRICLLLIGGTFIAMSLSDNVSAQISDTVKNAYAPKTYTSCENTLNYRFLTPESIEPCQKYPLVLFLHGAGERGDDNTKQLIHGLSEFLTPENRRDFPCFVVAPQCPSERKWAEVDWTKTEHQMPEEWSVPLGLTRDLLHKLIQEYPIDTSRLYITGLSMGGYGTWDYIQREPEFFAAAIPICGGADENYADRLTKLPIWAFHGDQDQAVPLIRTTRMVEAIRDAGGSPKMTIYPGVGHNSWTQTYANRDVFKWLFAQRRTAPSKCD